MNKHIYLSHTSKIKIPFYDVDSMDIVWHGNYVKYLEQARCDFLDSINYNYINMKQDHSAFPIVKINLKYIKPARFNEIISIEVNLIEYITNLQFEYIVHNDNNERIMKAASTQVAINTSNMETLFSTPKIFQNAIEMAKNFVPSK